MTHQTQLPAGETDKEVKVEFSNFHEVLEYFDEQGAVKDKEHARFSIPCGICKSFDLPLFNEEHESFSPERHLEFYTVLKCGHAFGSRCILSWLRHNFTCPLCRTRPFDNIKGNEALTMFGDVRHSQGEEIREIRKFLQNRSTAGPSTTGGDGQGPSPTTEFDDLEPFRRAYERVQEVFRLANDMLDERTEELVARQGNQG